MTEQTEVIERRHDMYLYEAIGHLRGQIEGLVESGKRTDNEVHKLGNLFADYMKETNKKMQFMSRSITILLILVVLNSLGVPIQEWVKLALRIVL